MSMSIGGLKSIGGIPGGISAPVFPGQVTALSFRATAPNGTDGFILANAGARLHFSDAGGTDYLIGNGSNEVQAAGAFRVGTTLNMASASDINMQTGGAVQFSTTTNLNAIFSSSGTLSFTGAGTAAANVVMKMTGVLNANSTGVGNVGASGPDTLQTYSLPANALTTTDRGLRIRAWGTTANNANAKTVRMVFGGTTLVTKQLTASVAGVWEIEATILRTGTSAQDYYAKALNSGGTTVASADGATVYAQHAFGTSTETETGAIVISTQSTVSTADNDIVSQGLLVEFV